MFWFIKEVPNPDMLWMYWSCSLVGQDCFNLKKPEDVPGHLPYHYIFREWLEIDGILSLSIYFLSGNIIFVINKAPEVNWNDLLKKMYPPESITLRHWQRFDTGVTPSFERASPAA